MCSDSSLSKVTDYVLHEWGKTVSIGHHVQIVSEM
jgi:hypothetical protein